MSHYFITLAVWWWSLPALCSTPNSCLSWKCQVTTTRWMLFHCGCNKTWASISVDLISQLLSLNQTFEEGLINVSLFFSLKKQVCERVPFFPRGKVWNYFGVFLRKSKEWPRLYCSWLEALRVCTFCSHESIILHDKVNVVLPVLDCSRRNMTLTTDYPRPVPSGVT